MTRTQAQQQEKLSKPLKVTEKLGNDITRDGLVIMQRQDDSLEKFIKEVQKRYKRGPIYSQAKLRTKYYAGTG